MCWHTPAGGDKNHQLMGKLLPDKPIDPSVKTRMFPVKRATTKRKVEDHNSLHRLPISPSSSTTYSVPLASKTSPRLSPHLVRTVSRMRCQQWLSILPMLVSHHPVRSHHASETVQTLRLPELPLPKGWNCLLAARLFKSCQWQHYSNNALYRHPPVVLHTTSVHHLHLILPTSLPTGSSGNTATRKGSYKVHSLSYRCRNGTDKASSMTPF